MGHEMTTPPKLTDEQIEQAFASGDGTHSGAGRAVESIRDQQWLDMLAAAPQPPQAYSEYVETACALIKAADDAAASSDYMLDSNDCISVLRGTWTGPMLNDRPQPPQQPSEPVNPYSGMGSMQEAWQRGFEGRPMLAHKGSNYARVYADGRAAAAIEAKLREKNGGGV